MTHIYSFLVKLRDDDYYTIIVIFSKFSEIELNEWVTDCIRTDSSFSLNCCIIFLPSFRLTAAADVVEGGVLDAFHIQIKCSLR